MRECAAKICRGMILDASVSHKEGFLPRGVSPVDCESHYIDTSRDQYTNWFYGAYRLYFSSLSSDIQKAELRRCLVSMAKKFEAEVISENDWHYFREDGEIGIAGVAKMWGDLHAAEFLRLPMLYLLTWKTTGDIHWKEQYLRYRDEAVEKTLAFVPLAGASYVGLQVQFSVRMVYELDADPNVRNKLRAFMQKMAAPYEEMAVKQAEVLMTSEGAKWLQIPYAVWRESKFRYAGVHGGKPYYIPEPSDFQEEFSYYPLRAVGEGMAVVSLCPDHRISDRSLEKLCQMAAFVDYTKHYTNAPIALLHGFWLSRATRRYLEE